MAPLPALSGCGKIQREYAAMGIYPSGHVMAKLRPSLSAGVATSGEVTALEDGTEVTVAGLVIRRQRTLGRAVFLTLEDEWGHTPPIVWPAVYESYRHVLKEPLVVVRGVVSRREGTMNVVISSAEALTASAAAPKANDWR